jgi:DNA processing protein
MKNSNSHEGDLIAAILLAQNKRIQKRVSTLPRGVHASREDLKEFILEESKIAERLDSQTMLNRARERGQAVLGIFCEEYPRLLFQSFQPPTVLYYQGTLPSSFAKLPALAVVGSRRASLESIGIAKTFSRQLAEAGICIVSGLALGVDGAAHSGALLASSQVECPSIAVLGSSLDRLYPKQHECLAKEIGEVGGLILSEYPPDTDPLPHQFLQRNRIVAGLSLGCLVVQASERSGSLVTARYAMDEGREVFVVPGSVVSSAYLGSHQLIKQGARLITDAKEILEEFGICSQSSQEALPEERASNQALISASILCTDCERIILQKLSDGGLWHDEALRKEFHPEEDFDTALLNLELKDYILRHPGNQLSIAPDFPVGALKS